MAQHRLTPPDGVVEARLRRATGGTPHRRAPQARPGAQAITALALAGVVAGGGTVVASVALRGPVDESSPSSPDAAGASAGGDTDGDTGGDTSGPDGSDAEAVPAAAAPAAPAAAPAAPARVAPAPVTPPAPASGAEAPEARAPIWRADGPQAFRSTPWNTVGTQPPQAEGDAVHFAVTGRNQRTELEPAVPDMTEGDEYYFGFRVRLDEDFPADGSSRQVITQWKNDNPGSAPVDLRVRNGKLVLHGGYGHPSGPSTFTKVVGPAPVGRWSHVVVRVRFSANPHKGSVSAWQDGEQEVHGYHPPGGTLYPGQKSYLKTGLAREPLISRPTSVTFRGWTVGPTLASVQ